jgi:hypothetical protein
MEGLGWRYDLNGQHGHEGCHRAITRAADRALADRGNVFLVHLVMGVLIGAGGRGCRGHRPVPGMGITLLGSMGRATVARDKGRQRGHLAHKPKCHPNLRTSSSGRHRLLALPYRTLGESVK